MKKGLGMFEVGKSYRFVTLETGDNYEGKWSTYETSIVYEVGAVDGSLVKCLGPDWSKDEFAEFLPAGTEKNTPRDETIINTASQFFVRAELQHESD